MDFFLGEFFTGRFLNGIVVLALSLTALFLGFTMLRSKTITREFNQLGYFWFFIWWAWVASSVRQFSSAIGLLQIDELFFAITQSFVFISVIFLAPYLFNKAFENRLITTIAQYIYIAGALAGTAGLIWFGSKLTTATPYATEYEPNTFTLILTITLIAILFLITLKESAQNFLSVFKKQKPWFAFFAPFSITLYLLFGFVDVSGIIGSWLIILFRLIFLVAFVLAYIAFAEEVAAKKETLGRGQRIIEI